LTEITSNYMISSIKFLLVYKKVGITIYSPFITKNVFIAWKVKFSIFHHIFNIVN
jgi:hypothetical protein